MRCKKRDGAVGGGVGQAQILGLICEKTLVFQQLLSAIAEIYSIIVIIAITIGIWSNRLLVSAALPRPLTVGWSGMPDRNTSRWFLNVYTWSEFMFRREEAGRRLKSRAPLTASDHSLAHITEAGQCLGTGAGTSVLPRLPSSCQTYTFKNKNRMVK